MIIFFRGLHVSFLSVAADTVTALQLTNRLEIAVKLRWMLAIVLLILCPSLSSLLAQEDDLAVETPAEEVVEVPESLASARATMRTFLEAFDDATRPEGVDPLQQAATTLDLSQIRQDLQQVKGQETAWQLKQVMDRIQRIDLDTLPDTSQAEPWILQVADLGEIVMAPNEQGFWLFDAATVEATPKLLQGVRSLDIVEGVTESTAMTFPLWLSEQMPESLRQEGFLLEHWQWLALIFLMLLAVILHWLVAKVGGSIIQRYLAARMESITGDAISRATRPVGWFVAALVCWFGILWLGLPTHILEILVVAVRFFAACTFVAAAYCLVDAFASVLEVRATKSTSKADDLLVPLFRKTAKVFVVAFGIAFLAETLELPVRSVVAGLGIGGLAVALAAQDAIKNFFGSLMVIFDRPFSVGDWVSIGDVKGTVVELGFRSTRIRTPYDSMVTLPNSNLINAAVDNYGQRRYRRWNTHLTIDYATPPDRIDAFCEGVRELIRLHPDTRKDSFEVHLNSFGDSALEILLNVFFTNDSWSGELKQRHSLALDILRLAENLEVGFAFPTQTVYLQRPSQPEVSPLADFDVRQQAAIDRGKTLAAQLAAGSVKEN